jgi:hypothetical protein
LELEFTLEVTLATAGILVPKLKQSYYDNKDNRGGQALVIVKIATVWYLCNRLLELLLPNISVFLPGFSKIFCHLLKITS